MVQVVVNVVRGRTIRVVQREGTDPDKPQAGGVPLESGFVVEAPSVEAVRGVAQIGSGRADVRATPQEIQERIRLIQARFTGVKAAAGTRVGGETAPAFTRRDKSGVKSDAQKSRESREADVRAAQRETILRERAKAPDPSTRATRFEEQRVKGQAVLRVRAAQRGAKKRRTTIQRGQSFTTLRGGRRNGLQETQRSQMASFFRTSREFGDVSRLRSTVSIFQSGGVSTGDMDFSTSFQERSKQIEQRSNLLAQREKRVADLASVVTGGRGRPVEQRGTVGFFAERTVGFGLGILTLPEFVGGRAAQALDKTILGFETAIRGGKGSIRSVGREFFITAPKKAGTELEQRQFSFLPGGTPITREGVFTAGTIGVGAAFPAVARVRASRPALSIESVEVGSGVTAATSRGSVSRAVATVRGTAGKTRIEADVGISSRTINLPSERFFTESRSAALLRQTTPRGRTKALQARETSFAESTPTKFRQRSILEVAKQNRQRPFLTERRTTVGKQRDFLKSPEELRTEQFSATFKQTRRGDVLESVGRGLTKQRVTGRTGGTEFRTVTSTDISLSGRANLQSIAQRFDLSKAQSIVTRTPTKRVSRSGTRSRDSRQVTETQVRTTTPATQNFATKAREIVTQTVKAEQKTAARAVSRRTTIPLIASGITSRAFAFEQPRVIPLSIQQQRQLPRQRQLPLTIPEQLPRQLPRQTPIQTPTTLTIPRQTTQQIPFARIPTSPFLPSRPPPSTPSPKKPFALPFIPKLSLGGGSVSTGFGFGVKQRKLATPDLLSVVGGVTRRGKSKGAFTTGLSLRGLSKRTARTQRGFAELF